MANDAIGEEMVLEVFAVPESDGRIFAIGPFATRLNFHRQQNRALTLVWALKGSHDGRYLGKRVAVIGAGLAGVTAAAALLGLNCEVTVYEGHSRVMNRQRLTTHRFAHPNVNYWPDERADPSTNLPFFNWMAADCASIADDIEAEWKEFAVHLDFRKGKHAQSISLLRPEIEIVDEDGPTRFDYVIVASGFKDEKTVKEIPSRSYWSTSLPDPPKKGEQPYFVSGAGDGGLIDALYLSHNDFKVGILIAEVAERLFKSPATAKRIKDEEAAIAERARARPRRQKGASGVIEDDALATEERCKLYKDVVKGLIPAIRDHLLDASLGESQPAVYLVSPLAEPFSANAAPIHKLMLAHALEAKRIKHIKARIRETPSGPVLGRGRAGGITLDPKRTIIRHGASFELDLLEAAIPKFGDKLRAQQARAHELIDKKPLWKKGDFPDRRYGPQGLTDAEFLKLHETRAQRLSKIIPAIALYHPAHANYLAYQVVARVPTELGGRDIPDMVFGRELRREGPSSLPPGPVLNG